MVGRGSWVVSCDDQSSFTSTTFTRVREGRGKGKKEGKCDLHQIDLLLNLPYLIIAGRASGSFGERREGGFFVASSLYNKLLDFFWVSIQYKLN